MTARTYNDINNGNSAGPVGNTVKCVMHYDHSHDNDGAGFLVYADSARPASGNIVRHNIRLNDARKLAFVGIMIAGSGVSGIDVYNNTVHLGKAGGNASARQLTS